MNLENATCPAGLLQRIDTASWTPRRDGWEPVPRGKRSRGPPLSQRGIFRKCCSLPTTMRAQAPTWPSGERTMNFYAKQHQFYCGIDLHARLLAVCILDQAGHIVCQTKIPADKQILLDTLA